MRTIADGSKVAARKSREAMHYLAKPDSRVMRFAASVLVLLLVGVFIGPGSVAETSAPPIATLGEGSFHLDFRKDGGSDGVARVRAVGFAIGENLTGSREARLCDFTWMSYSDGSVTDELSMGDVTLREDKNIIEPGAWWGQVSMVGLAVGDRYDYEFDADCDGAADERGTAAVAGLLPALQGARCGATQAPYDSARIDHWKPPNGPGYATSSGDVTEGRGKTDVSSSGNAYAWLGWAYAELYGDGVALPGAVGTRMRATAEFTGDYITGVVTSGGSADAYAMSYFSIWEHDDGWHHVYSGYVHYQHAGSRQTSQSNLDVTHRMSHEFDARADASYFADVGTGSVVQVHGGAGAAETDVQFTQVTWCPISGS